MVHYTIRFACSDRCSGIAVRVIADGGRVIWIRKQILIAFAGQSQHPDQISRNVLVLDHLQPVLVDAVPRGRRRQSIFFQNYRLRSAACRIDMVLLQKTASDELGAISILRLYATGALKLAFFHYHGALSAMVPAIVVLEY